MPVLKNARQERLAQLVTQRPGLAWAEIAKQAGYSNKANACNAAKAKPVAARIRELKGKAAAKAEISLERVMREYAAVGFARATDYMRIGEDGLPIVDFSAMTDEQKAALAEITVDQLDVVRDGKTGKETQRVKFKLHDKLQALTRLREHLGFVNKTALTNPDGTPLTITWLTEAEAKARGLG
jgi:phage terminase small subunit